MPAKNPFDFVDDVSFGKSDRIRNADNPEFEEKEYVPYLTNAAFSYHIDSILYANLMNTHHYLPKLMQHDFYLHVLRKRKRYATWAKLEKNSDLDLIANILQVNKRVSATYLKLLTEEQLQEVRKVNATGGLNEEDSAGTT